MPTVLISGASTGIGQATALRLARAGWSVLAGVRSTAAGEELLALAASEGSDGGVKPIELDVTDAAQVASAAEHVSQVSPQGLDALINNAGIGIAGPTELLS